MSYLSYVNPLQGTASVFGYSNGNTLPLVSRPFGMAAWSPQTKDVKDGWFFHPGDRLLSGIRLTRQPSPWIGDYGQLLLLPQSGPLCLETSKRQSSFRPEDMIVKPDYLSVRLSRYRASLEVTPAERGASLRLNYERAQGARLLISAFEGEAGFRIDCERRRITGFTRTNRGGAPDNFAQYFVIEFDCELDEKACGIYDAGFAPVSAMEYTGEGAGAYAGFKLPDGGGQVGAKFGVSFISIEQAALNLERELGESDFETVHSQAAEAWESRLGTVEIGGDEDESRLRTFYTCLYRTFLFPRKSYELNAEGNPVHFSPFNGKLYDGFMYSDIGFWDIYRTTIPLFSLLCPGILGEMMASWVNAYKESGWMPKWVSPGERGAMPGTLVDAAFADAIVKGVGGFDMQVAYEGLLKHATQEADLPLVGREGLALYERLGYLPDDIVHHSVSHSLDYAYGDFCIGTVAKALGDEAAYRTLTERSRNYRRLFDATAGFMRGRKENGEWTPDFDPLDWGGPYCEGGAWQCGWAVQHDLLGLAELYGGREQMAAKLDELFASPPDFNVGSYGFEIHEMSEMAAANLGQFAISNQPSFHIPYIYTALGYPAPAQYWVRKTLETQFSAEPDGLPGDEDNGSLCAWYIFGAMGLYPLCPGVPEYVVGSPLFGRMRIRLENGNDLVISSDQPARTYVANIRLNDQTHEPLYFTHAQLTGGATIDFEMAAEPADKYYEPRHLPFSLSAL